MHVRLICSIDTIARQSKESSLLYHMISTARKYGIYFSPDVRLAIVQVENEPVFAALIMSMDIRSVYPW